MASGWATDDRSPTPRAEVADHAARRRAALSLRFPGERLVIPGGGLKVRSNDTDYTFRPHTLRALEPDGRADHALGTDRPLAAGAADT
ncbi:aminopeptidase P family protein, partial [Streptomyces sp. NPDC049910]